MKSKFLATILVFYFSSIAFSQTISPDNSAPLPEKPFEMLIIGDSIIWGQGHEDGNKFTYLIKDWLKGVKFSNKRPVNMLVKAHSGASITQKKESKINPKTYLHGEINVWTPNIRQQAQDAFDCYRQPTASNSCYQDAGVPRANLSFYQGGAVYPENVDLIIVDGCINDMPAGQIFNLFYLRSKLKKSAKKYCEVAMADLLTDLVNKFPNAKILVTGYYPLISINTDPDVLVKALVNAFGENWFARKMNAFLKLFSRKEFDKLRFIRNELANRSLIWHQASVAGLRSAVLQANNSLRKKNLAEEDRIFYSSPDFKIENAFAASQTFLWKLDDKLETDDPLFNKRKQICADEQLKHWKSYKRFICHRAGLFHPNVEGANEYFKSLQNTLDEIFKKTESR
jgi:hypothetical protein